MGLVRALRSLAELRNIPSDARTLATDSTLPLSVIRSRADVQSVLAYLVELARNRLGYDLGDVLDATKVVSELCYNVVDHSQTEGVAVAQIYQDRTGKRFVSLAVVDDGVGIRSSLAQRYPEAASWSHAKAVQQALDGLSSRPLGGGAGLRSVRAIVRRYQGRLAIRSGSDRLYLSAERQPRVLAGSSFPGTQVGISFSQIAER
jgi:anti-sigma regulatory factor (Ser/Thr protein kinase)